MKFKTSIKSLILGLVLLISSFSPNVDSDFIIDPYRFGAGAPAYDPGMMTYDGSTGYYTDTTPDFFGNLATTVVRFNIESFSGGGHQRIVHATAASGSRVLIRAWSNDYAEAERRDKISVTVQNDSGTEICNLLSLTELVDGNAHVLFFAFSGDAGTAVFYADSLAADDSGFSTRVAPTTGTLDVAQAVMSLGARSTGSNFVAGDIGFFGISNTYLTNPEAFSIGSTPIEQDEDVWANSGWGVRPLFWEAQGEMDLSVGSAGNMTENGTITGPS